MNGAAVAIAPELTTITSLPKAISAALRSTILSILEWFTPVIELDPTLMRILLADAIRSEVFTLGLLLRRRWPLERQHVLHGPWLVDPSSRSIRHVVVR